MKQEPITDIDVVIIGGGQSGLAVGYFLRRTNHSFVLLDAGIQPGGAWQQGWNSLRLFSPADASSLPGWPMPRPADAEQFPHWRHVIDYLTQYESRYALPVQRPVQINNVTKVDDLFLVRSATKCWRARAVVSATGSASAPFIPSVSGREVFAGTQIHSSAYRSPAPFRDKRVLVVGGGNSGAQILAEVSTVAQTTWVTLTDPTFLPDEVDGRVLFSRATERYKATVNGTVTSPPSLGDIVMVPSVRQARDRGVLCARRTFERLTRAGVRWPDGHYESFDAIIWCTGFRPATDYLRPLGIVGEGGRVTTDQTRAVALPGLWLVGYGSWTGFASATLIGVGRSARQTADEVHQYIQHQLTTT